MSDEKKRNGPDEEAIGQASDTAGAAEGGAGAAAAAGNADPEKPVLETGIGQVNEENQQAAAEAGDKAAVIAEQAVPAAVSEAVGEAVEAADKTAAPAAGAAASAEQRQADEAALAEAGAQVGELTPEAARHETPLSADASAKVARAAELQQADPAQATTSEPSDPPAAEVAEPREPAADVPAASPMPRPADAAPVDPEREAKLKAAAEARAARAAAKAAEGGAGAEAAGGGADAEAKARAEARAARAAARAAKTGEGEPDKPKEPSPNQPLLDRLVEILKQTVAEDAVEQAFINEMDGHRPYVIIKGEHWLEAAKTFRDHEELKCDYLRNLSGVDQETHLEVAYHLLSLSTKQEYCVKVKTDREAPSVPSVTSVWETANWNEREVYDLLGIDFPGHPDLRRIMMPDDWVGYPLRKDYVPLDPEV